MSDTWRDSKFVKPYVPQVGYTLFLVHGFVF